MQCYVGLDVSLKQTSICVVDQAGAVVREGVVDSDPEAISAYVRSKAPDAVRIGLETGPTSTWLWTELKRLGLPVICIDARHAKAVLKMQINKSDRNDAAGIARIMQTGWFKQVRVKDLDSHAVKALLASRALLVKMKRDLENQIRGLLKNLGLIIGTARGPAFHARVQELVEGKPYLAVAFLPLLVDQTGKVLCEGTVNSTPEAIVEFVKSKAPGAVRIGLETGPPSTWLWTEIKALGLPVICIDARHAKTVLKMQINKSDRNDAFGIARIMQCGWYKEVRVKGLDSHAMRALLESRALLVKMKRDLENQIRGLLKNLGLVIGRAKMNVFLMRVVELTEARPELAAAVEPLLKAREAVEKQIADLDRKVMQLARNDVQVRRFMTAPGVGPITALCYLATIDDPTRFKRS